MKGFAVLEISCDGDDGNYTCPNTTTVSYEHWFDRTDEVIKKALLDRGWTVRDSDLHFCRECTEHPDIDTNAVICDCESHTSIHCGMCGGAIFMGVAKVLHRMACEQKVDSS